MRWWHVGRNLICASNEGNQLFLLFWDGKEGLNLQLMYSNQYYPPSWPHLFNVCVNISMLSIRNKQNWLLSIFQLLMSFFAVDLKGLFRLYPLSLCHLILQRFQDLLRQLLSTLVHIFLNSTSSKDWKDFYKKFRHPYHLSNKYIV